MGADILYEAPWGLLLICAGLICAGLICGAVVFGMFRSLCGGLGPDGFSCLEWAEANVVGFKEKHAHLFDPRRFLGLSYEDYAPAIREAVALYKRRGK